MQKVAIRHKALKALGRRPTLVLDMFAGEGVMTQRLWTIAADSVICIERDSSKASMINGASKIIVGENRDFLDLAADADIIDCDAYGLVMQLISQLPSGKIVVFTDGSLERAKYIRKEFVNFRKDVRDIFEKFEYVENISGTAYYGWGVTK